MYIGVKTNPTAKKTLIGKINESSSGEKSSKARKIFSAEILPTSAWDKKILKRESKTNPKRTSEIQQMFTIISLLMNREIITRLE